MRKMQINCEILGRGDCRNKMAHNFYNWFISGSIIQKYVRPDTLLACFLGQSVYWRPLQRIQTSNSTQNALSSIICDLRTDSVQC